MKEQVFHKILNIWYYRDGGQRKNASPARQRARRCLEVSADAMTGLRRSAGWRKARVAGSQGRRDATFSPRRHRYSTRPLPAHALLRHGALCCATRQVRGNWAASHLATAPAGYKGVTTLGVRGRARVECYPSPITNIDAKESSIVVRWPCLTGRGHEETFFK